MYVLSQKKWFVLFWMCDFIALTPCCKRISFFTFNIFPNKSVFTTTRPFSNNSKTSTFPATNQIRNFRKMFITVRNCTATLGKILRPFPALRPEVVFTLYNRCGCTTVYWTRAYTPCLEKTAPKNAQITLWIENDNHYFSLYHEKAPICNVFVKFMTTSLSIAEILLFIKKDGGKLPSPTLPINSCA